MNKFCVALLLSLLGIGNVWAQNQGPAVGEWKAMNCYYTAQSAAFLNGKIYCGTSSGMFVYDQEDEMSTAFSKVGGMADVGVVKIIGDSKTGKVLLAYENSNLDIFDNGQFYNVPDIKNTSIAGDKTIQHLMAFDGFAYAATPIGLIVVNLDKKEVAYTVSFFEGASKAAVYSSLVNGDYIYAATSQGLMRIDKFNSNKQDYSKWTKVNTQIFHQIAANENGFFGLRNAVSGIAAQDSVFKFSTTFAPTYFYTSTRNIRTISVGKKPGLWIGEDYAGTAGSVKFINLDGIISQNTTAFFPSDIIELSDGSVFFAENDMTQLYGGLRKLKGDGSTISYTPDGPESPYATDVWAYNGEVWLAHGGHTLNWSFIGHTKAFSTFRKNKWYNYTSHVSGLGASMLSDASVIFKDRNTNTVFVGMAAGGFIEVNDKDELTLLQEPYFGKFGAIFVGSGIAQDNNGNLWFSNYGADQDIRLKTQAGEWFAFHPMASSSRMSHSIIVDDYGNKWAVLVSGGGVVVFNEKETYTDASDDLSRVLRAGSGNGNLPSSEAYCVAKDKNNAIWIGTNDGIAIVDQPNEVLAGTKDANIRIVQYGDEPAGALFKGKSVMTIAVDGSNNKWVGTSDAGLWLVSESGDEVLAYFTVDNSPLPSNQINNIDIDPYTGDVYCATAKGLVVYRGNATANIPNEASALFIYPNPVPSGFQGNIAIKGLTATRSEIRIVDVAGQLVAQFSTEGGQAVWNGKDYTGRRPQTGVYVVLVTDKSTGKTIQSGKFIFNE